jgi:hypothetical protein
MILLVNFNPTADGESLIKIMEDNYIDYERIYDSSTILLSAIKTYSTENYNPNSKVIHYILNQKCNPGGVEESYYMTPLIYCFTTYCRTCNYDPTVIERLLDMDCNPTQKSYYGVTAIKNAFNIFAHTPNCDISIILKLILVTYNKITRLQLCKFLDYQTEDKTLKDDIIALYTYRKRMAVINSRVSRRAIRRKIKISFRMELKFYF